MNDHESMTKLLLLVA